MSKLPKELFIRIIDLLSLPDQLNCLLVNKQWNADLRDHCLFKEMCFANRKPDLLQAYPMLNEQKLGRRTKILSFFQVNFTESLISALPRLFPNVEMVYFEECEYKQFPPKALLRTEFKRWSKNLRFLKIDDLLLQNLLQAGPFHGLLELDIVADLFSEYEHISLFKSLSSLPNLQSITMFEVSMTLKELYSLNSSCPSLKEIHFGHLEIADDPDVPIKISIDSGKPCLNIGRKKHPLDSRANNMRMIHVQTVDTAECGLHAFQWLAYFGLMYPLLETFKFPLSDSERYMPSLAAAVSHWPAIRCIKAGSVGLSAILEAMDRNKSRLEDLTFFYQNDNFMEHCRSISASKQGESILKLDIRSDGDESLSVDKINIPIFQHTLQHLKCLTSLKLTGSLRSSVWVSILQHPSPCLTNVTMMCHSTMEDHIPVKVPLQSPIKKLSVTFVRKPGSTLAELNASIATLLSLCNNVESLEIDENIFFCSIKKSRENGKLLFDMTNMQRLKKFDLSIYSTRYYILENHRGLHRAKWLNQNALKPEENAVDPKFKGELVVYANWNGEPSVRLATGSG